MNPRRRAPWWVRLARAADAIPGWFAVAWWSLLLVVLFICAAANGTTP